MQRWINTLGHNETLHSDPSSVLVEVFLSAKTANYGSVLVPHKYFLFFNFDTLNCWLYTSNCRLYSLNCRLYTSNCRLYSLKCIIDTSNCRLYTSNCRLYTLKCIIDTSNCRLYSLNCRLYTSNCRLYSLKCFNHMLNTHPIFIWNTTLCLPTDFEKKIRTKNQSALILG